MKEMKGRRKNIPLILWSKVMTFSLQKFPTLNQTITFNKGKNPKYCYRLNLNMYHFQKRLNPKYKTLHITLTIIHTKIILDEPIMN
jgi:hypothetical protein